MRIAAPCSPEMIAWVRPARDAENAVKVDLDLCDLRGAIAVELRGVALRPASLEFIEPAVAAPAQRKVITLMSPVARRQRGAISLVAPTPSGAPSAPPSGKGPVALSEATVVAPGAPVAAGVRLYDDGNGIFRTWRPDVEQAKEIELLLREVHVVSHAIGAIDGRDLDIR